MFSFLFTFSSSSCSGGRRREGKREEEEEEEEGEERVKERRECSTAGEMEKPWLLEREASAPFSIRKAVALEVKREGGNFESKKRGVSPFLS